MKIALTAVLVVVVAAATGIGGYFVGHNAGLSDAQNIRAQFFQQRSGQGGQGGPGGPSGQGGQGGQGGFAGRRPAAFGTVKSVQGNTIELSMQDGSTVTVNTDAQTTVIKTVTGAVTDIQPGQRITVMGAQGSGGTPAPGETITASEISIQSNQPSSQ